MAHIAKRTTLRGEARYDVRWRLPSGLVQTKTFRRRADADAFRRRVEADELVGIVADLRRQSATFEDVARAWLKPNPGKRARSLARDGNILAKHVLPVLGSRRVRSITRDDVQALVNVWANELAPRTVARMYAVVRAVMAHAEDSELIARSPCRKVRLPEADEIRRPILDVEGLERLAVALGADQAVFMWVGVVLGLRWAECAGLTVSRLDHLLREVTVEFQLGLNGLLVRPKSKAGRRTLAAPAWLMDELALLLARRGLNAADRNALVFVSPTGASLRYSNWRRRVWLPATRAAGLEGLLFHDLRSNATTALIAEGVDVKVAQVRIGHSDPRITLGLYPRATPEADRRAADRVGERFRPRDGRAMEGDQRRSGRPQKDA